MAAGETLLQGFTLSKGGDRTWEWRVFAEDGRELRRSGRAFRTLIECVRDATRNGYDLETASGDTRLWRYASDAGRSRP
jgi:hypothetical protein